MGDGGRRVALVWSLGGIVAIGAALLFTSELEAGSEDAGGGVILVGVLTPIALAAVLRVLDGEGRFLRDAATAAAGYGMVLGAIAAGMRTLDASRGYTFFVITGYFFVVGWVSALLLVGARNLVRRGLRLITGDPGDGPTAQR